MSTSPGPRAPFRSFPSRNCTPRVALVLRRGDEVQHGDGGTEGRRTARVRRGDQPVELATEHPDRRRGPRTRRRSRSRSRGGARRLRCPRSTPGSCRASPARSSPPPTNTAPVTPVGGTAPAACGQRGCGPAGPRWREDVAGAVGQQVVAAAGPDQRAVRRRLGPHRLWDLGRVELHVVAQRERSRVGDPEGTGAARVADPGLVALERQDQTAALAAVPGRVADVVVALRAATVDGIASGTPAVCRSCGVVCQRPWKTPVDWPLVEVDDRRWWLILGLGAVGVLRDRQGRGARGDARRPGRSRRPRAPTRRALRRRTGGAA